MLLLLPPNLLHVLIPGLPLLSLLSDMSSPHVKPKHSRVIRMHLARGEGGCYWSFSFPILLPVFWGRAERGLEPRGTTEFRNGSKEKPDPTGECFACQDDSWHHPLCLQGPVSSRALPDQGFTTNTFLSKEAGKGIA